MTNVPAEMVWIGEKGCVTWESSGPGWNQISDFFTKQPWCMKSVSSAEIYVQTAEDRPWSEGSNVSHRVSQTPNISALMQSREEKTCFTVWVGADLRFFLFQLSLWLDRTFWLSSDFWTTQVRNAGLIWPIPWCNFIPVCSPVIIVLGLSLQ